MKRPFFNRWRQNESFCATYIACIVRVPQSRLSFIGYQVRKTVWSNQLNIIPKTMKMMASLVKLFGGFISVEDSGRDMLPLFLENETLSVEKSGKLITSKKNLFPEIPSQ